ncbi:MAG: RidA family protein [Caldilineaceae bacterium]
MTNEIIDPGWAWPANFGLVAGIKRGNTIYLSGYVSVNGTGELVGEDDMYVQAKQIFQNIQDALASAGATMQDVVKVNAYLVDMARYTEFAKARAEAFPQGTPASTAVGVAALAAPIFLVEVEAVAEIDK